MLKITAAYEYFFLCLTTFYIICKSLDLGRGADPHSYIVEEIWQELARAKYQEWERDSTKRSWDLQNLKYVILRMLEEVARWVGRAGLGNGLKQVWIETFCASWLG